MITLLVVIFGLVIGLISSMIGLVIRLAFYLSPIGLVYILLRPRGFRHYCRCRF